MLLTRISKCNWGGSPIICHQNIVLLLSITLQSKNIVKFSMKSYSGFYVLSYMLFHKAFMKMKISPSPYNDEPSLKICMRPQKDVGHIYDTIFHHDCMNEHNGVKPLLWRSTYTVLHMFRQVLFWAENQDNHQNFKKTLLSYKLWLVFMQMKHFFFFFFEKKIQNGRLKKCSFSSSANSQYFFLQKFHGLVL